MITNLSELEALIESTADLIAQDPVDVVLRRSTYERTDAGGVRKTAETNQVSQVLFLGGTTEPRLLKLDTGEEVESRHVLIGLPGANIMDDDKFTVGSREFLVLEVHPDRSYQCKAWIVERT